MALLQLTIYRCMFWTDYLIVLMTNFLLDVDDRNNKDVGELSNRVGGKMDTDSGSIFDGYSDVTDDECDGVNAEDELTLYYQCWMMRSFIFVRRKRNPSICNV